MQKLYSPPTVFEQSQAVSAIQTLLQEGEEQYKSLKELLPASLPGVLSLAHRLRTEINVLHKGLRRGDWLKPEHVHSSNLHQLGAIVDLATALGDKVDGVLQKFRDEASVPVFVDIVANGGLLWVKVVCRCPNTLQLAHLTGGRAGERPPLEQAAVLQRLAAQHTVLYTRPKVALVFCKGVSYTVCRALRRQGVLVLTQRLIPDAMLTASRYTDASDDGDSCVGDERLEGDMTSDSASSDEEDEILEAGAADDGLGKNYSVKSLKEALQFLHDPLASSAGQSFIFSGNDHSLSEEDAEGRSGDSALDSPYLSEEAITIVDESPATIRVEINGCLERNDELSSFGTKTYEEDHEPNRKKQWPMSSKEEMTRIAENIETLMSRCELVSKAQKSRALVTESEKFNSNHSESMSKENVNSLHICDNKNCVLEESSEKNEVVNQGHETSDVVSKQSVVQLSHLPDRNSTPSQFATTDPPWVPLLGALPLDTTACPPSPGDGSLVCLDVPCMIAYVSNTTNGHAHYSFEDKFLLEQAAWERKEPANPVIETYWRGQRVVVCEEAVRRFESIVGVMAGPEERRRADQLLSAVTVVPDCEALQDALSVCGGITASARTVFGTALHYHAPVITANRRFVRAAHTQGVRIAALFHSPRALTEQKQTPRREAQT